MTAVLAFNRLLRRMGEWDDKSRHVANLNIILSFGITVPQPMAIPVSWPLQQMARRS